MRVFITGATGFIGSHLAEALHQKGYQLRCLVRKTSNLVWIKHLPIEFVYGSLFDQDILSSAIRDVDYIYHVAGVTKAKTKKEFFKGNHIATKNLLDSAFLSAEKLRRFVHVSSQAAVGPSFNNQAINEQTPFHPITAYGISKMGAEIECLKMMDKIPITITRPPAVYGPRDTDVFEFFNTINKGLQPMIGFGKKYVSLIHVSDLVKGIILAGEHPGAVGQTYFISSEQFYHWQEIGDLTAHIMQKKTVRLPIPVFVVYSVFAVAEFFSLFSDKPPLLSIDKAKDIAQNAWTCDVTKAKRELGFKEQLSLEDGIRGTVEWYREHGWLK